MARPLLLPVYNKKRQLFSVVIALKPTLDPRAFLVDRTTSVGRKWSQFTAHVSTIHITCSRSLSGFSTLLCCETRHIVWTLLYTAGPNSHSDKKPNSNSHFTILHQYKSTRKPSSRSPLFHLLSPHSAIIELRSFSLELTSSQISKAW